MSNSKSNSKIYERVFKGRSGRYISLLLSDATQDKIRSVFANSSDEEEKYKLMQDIVSFLDDNNIYHGENIKDEGDDYYLSFTAEVPTTNADGSFTLESNIADNNNLSKVKDYTKTLGLIEGEDIDINRFYIRLNHSQNIEIINHDESYYPKYLSDVLDRIKVTIIDTINEVIKVEFSDVFYPVKYVRFNVWDRDNGNISVNFDVKSKTKGGIEQIYELNDELEKYF